MKPKCWRARRAAWKRRKMREDPEYRLNQESSNRKWAEAHPGYWKEYRKRNPGKAERNRILQIIRNRHRSKKVKIDARGDPLLIAKVDASDPASFRDTQELGKAIDAFVKAYEKTAKPFAWRKREVKGSQLKNTIVNLRN